MHRITLSAASRPHETVFTVPTVIAMKFHARGPPTLATLFHFYFYLYLWAAELWTIYLQMLTVFISLKAHAVCCVVNVSVCRVQASCVDGTSANQQQLWSELRICVVSEKCVGAKETDVWWDSERQSRGMWAQLTITHHTACSHCMHYCTLGLFASSVLVSRLKSLKTNSQSQDRDWQFQYRDTQPQDIYTQFQDRNS